ncbi:MAG: hypothetical protein UR80_C0008G0010 [Parcubacteria group bacterium GW2011_GWB1_35_5]|nr:MAG: hypothetical protein UR80_C0008G0010 [Parcubacteria group bacterium GW2011_GWB1_35_5]
MEFPLPKTPFKNSEDEISHLRKLIAEKEKHLEDVGLKKDSLASTRETLAEYKTTPVNTILHPQYKIDEKEIEKIVLNLSPEEHDKQINELVLLAKEKGIKNALSVVEKMQNFHITDDFHRFISEYLKEGFTIPGFSAKEKISKGLNMSLYEILIPEDNDKGEGKISLEEVISGMEQFYAGMFSINTDNKTENWMSLEIANANFSQEIIFYVAVPTLRKSLFEKQILSIFHNAKITEKPDDYNIFNETGYTAGVEAAFTKNPIFPLKTYESFVHDPLNSILSSFSKVNRDGEGASIQLIWYPVGDKYIKKYKNALDKIQDGVPLKEAIDIPDSISGEVVHTLKDIFSSSKSKKEEEEKKPTPIDMGAVEEIKRKISSPIGKCNLRLMASSNTKEEAEEILNSLKSSFNQFNNTLGNSLEWKKREKGDLRNLVKNFSFRIFDEDTAIPLNLREVTSIMHFHTKAVSASEGLRQSRSATAPAPFDISREGILLGINNHRNILTEIKMNEDDRLRHFYCIGQTGTGKTTLLKEMIIQDMQMGHGVCMIDPHGSDLQDVIANVPKERFEDVIYFDPGFTARPMALNMLEYDENFPEQKTFVVNELFSIFQKLYGDVPESMGPAFEQYFRNSALLVMDHPESGNTLVDMSRALSDKTYRDFKISKCKNPLVKQFWINAEKTTGEQGLANYVQYVTNKFDVFLANDIMRPVIAQEKSSFNFRDIMDNKKILLVNLSKGKLGDINANLIGLILVGKILIAALSRADSFGPSADRLPPFYLYIDEFQNITTNSIATILSEARKYKLSLNIAHQFIAQLEDNIREAVFGNVGSICAFRVGADDSEALESQFVPTFSKSDLMNVDNHNAYLRLLVNGKPARPFNIKVPPPLAGDINQIEKLKEMSYLKYGKPREEIEKLILEKYKSL